MVGIIEQLDPRKFGFIKYPGGRAFFHQTDLWEMPWSDSLVGTRVEFTWGRNERDGRPKAENVIPLD